MKRLLSLFAAIALLLLCSDSALAQSIGMYGDSTMAGWTAETGTATITPRNAPAQLSAMALAAGYDVTVTNHGVFGITSNDLINGTNGVPTTWANQMAQSTESIIIVNIGLNDVLAVYNGTETWQQFVANWQYIITVAQAHGKGIFIETMNPRTDAGGAYENECYQLVLHEVAVFEQTSGVGFIDAYTAITTEMPNWQSHLPDGIHPDDTMYTFKATLELAQIAKWLNLTYPIYNQIPTANALKAAK